jgi:hypothetical protein
MAMTFKTDTIDEIVDDMMFRIEDQDKQMFINSDHSLEHAWIEIVLMRWIRNRYGLWHTHPLTKRWREDGPNDLRDGVDYSSDHPDNISGVIYERFKERLVKAASR